MGSTGSNTRLVAGCLDMVWDQSVQVVRCKTGGQSKCCRHVITLSSPPNDDTVSPRINNLRNLSSRSLYIQWIYMYYLYISLYLLLFF